MIPTLWCLAVFGSFISLLNFYLSFIRRPLLQLLRPRQPFRWISGVPVIGSPALWIAAAGFWWTGNHAAALAGVGISLLDTGGLHWFALVVISEWRTADRLKATPPGKRAPHHDVGTPPTRVKGVGVRRRLRRTDTDGNPVE